MVKRREREATSLAGERRMLARKKKGGSLRIGGARELRARARIYERARNSTQKYERARILYPGQIFGPPPLPNDLQFVLFH